MAKYPHIWVKDGVWYPAGAEVPVKEPISEVATEETVSETSKEKKSEPAKK